MAIITTEDLAPWTKFSQAELDDHPLAKSVMWQVSAMVNAAAKREWDIDSEDPQKHPPDEARVIAIQLAARTFSNPRMVQARTAGPINERLAEEVITGMAFRPHEIEALQALRPSDKSGGLWIQPLQGTTDRDDRVWVDAYGSGGTHYGQIPQPWRHYG